jgi:hypothetical protein
MPASEGLVGRRSKSPRGGRAGSEVECSLRSSMLEREHLLWCPSARFQCLLCNLCAEGESQRFVALHVTTQPTKLISLKRSLPSCTPPYHRLTTTRTSRASCERGRWKESARESVARE